MKSIRCIWASGVVALVLTGCASATVQQHLQLRTSVATGVGSAVNPTSSCPAFFVDQTPPAFVAGAQPRTTEVCYTEYTLLASGVTKGALYSAEHLTAAEVAGDEKIGREGDFHADTHLPAEDRSQPTDYTHSGFDRGHMTPAGDPSTVDAEKETFSMANMVPQDHKLNTGEWAKIEAAVRVLATSRGEVYVVTGPAFSQSPAVIGANAVSVPAYTWKAIYEPGTGAGAYLCLNVDVSQCQVVAVAQVVQLSGVDPFPSLSPLVKATAIVLPLP